MLKTLFLVLTVIFAFNGCAPKANFIHTPIKETKFLKPIDTLKQ